MQSDKAIPVPTLAQSRAIIDSLPKSLAALPLDDEEVKDLLPSNEVRRPSEVTRMPTFSTPYGEETKLSPM